MKTLTNQDIQNTPSKGEIILYQTADGRTSIDVIISIGYRVHSQRGVQFRRWANSVLKDYLIKGYAVKNNLAQQKYDNLKALVDVMGISA